MKKIPDQSVDLILTDPPYNLRPYSTGNMSFSWRAEINNDLAEWDGDFDPASVLDDFRRVLKPTGRIFAFTSYNLLGRWQLQLFDYLVVGQVVEHNPAAAVKGPKHVVKKGRTPVLTAQEARQLLDSIDTTGVVGLRDRAMIGVMLFSFARVGAVVGMKVENYYLCQHPLSARR